MKILWADDQIEVASTFGGLLEACSHKVVFAPDAEVALLLIHNGQFDVVLADLRMPPGKWGGLWLLEQLKSVPDAPAVVIVSGEGAQPETIQALRLGAVDYITKDRLHDELVNQMKALEVTLNVRRGVIGLIATGEGQHIEFKSTLRYNLHAKKIDQAIELATLKTIAGFLNSAGGTLLIGVSDLGDILGVENDQFTNIDKFQLHFWNLIREAIGPEVSNFLTTSMLSHSEKNLFRVDCKPSSKPVFLRWKAANESKTQDLFFVRAGPQTELLGTRQAVDYIDDHFRRVKGNA
jgi:CheY-like chemotaxis protein